MRDNIIAMLDAVEKEIRAEITKEAVPYHKLESLKEARVAIQEAITALLRI